MTPLTALTALCPPPAAVPPAPDWSQVQDSLRLRGQIEEVRQTARHRWPLSHPLEKLSAMGVTGNGDYLFWVTQPADTPDEWTVAVNETLRAPWFTYDGSLTEFLVSVLSGTTSVPMFPADLLDRAPAFTPSTLESSTPAALGRTSVSTRTIRDCANANGYHLPDRGRIPPRAPAVPLHIPACPVRRRYAVRWASPFVVVAVCRVLGG
ncbi:hypothetical protein ACIPPM_21375 [Streptomyces sp. NPDC090119]|uniref:hypothetical protein n=1 Tax=Streptomyces sp. NPDC090119 TaxID=3365951 RepID=UPI0037FA515A